MIMAISNSTTVSIVSHGQFNLLLPLIKNLKNCEEVGRIIGGMFLIFSSYDYKKLKVFDSNFFLYFEDVDLCRRAKNLGLNVAQSKNFTVIHEAQRQSYSNLNHFKLHIKSYFLYLKKYYLNLKGFQ